MQLSLFQLWQLLKERKVNVSDLKKLETFRILVYLLIDTVIDLLTN